MVEGEGCSITIRTQIKCNMISGVENKVSGCPDYSIKCPD